MGNWSRSRIDELDLGEGDPDDAAPTDAGLKPDKAAIATGTSTDPYVDIPEIGRITDVSDSTKRKSAGGKAEERGWSNGFFVNVLGRVVNQSDPSFGAENLSHAAWARSADCEGRRAKRLPQY